VFIIIFRGVFEKKLLVSIIFLKTTPYIFLIIHRAISVRKYILKVIKDNIPISKLFFGQPFGVKHIMIKIHDELLHYVIHSASGAVYIF